MVNEYVVSPLLFLPKDSAKLLLSSCGPALNDWSDIDAVMVAGCDVIDKDEAQVVTN